MSMMKETMTADLTVANTILEQLGGRRFLVMTGAKNLTGGPHHLTFQLPRSKDGANYVTIRLNGGDTYDIETVSARTTKKGLVRTPKTYLENIYCDQLEAVIGRITGLATRL